jgi:di/tricarboxylate transporter
MWATFAIVLVAIVFFVGEWVSLEIVSLAIMAGLLLLFHFFPMTGADGANLLGPEVLLSGFANTALLTILALLVVGQGLHQSGALDGLTQLLSKTRGNRARLMIWLCLIGAGIMSAFLNNTPVVVMFIPVIAALANRYGPGAGRLLMPLSFITILGGMVTLVGSSTNLLVAGLVNAGHVVHLGFFDLLMPGVILAGVGTLYVVFIAPGLLAHGKPKAPKMRSRAGVQYLARLELHHPNKLIGEKSVGGMFASLKGVTVRLVKRQAQIFLPPFEDVELHEGDAVQLAGTRQQVTQLIDLGRQGDHLLMAEAAIAPGSALAGQPIVDAIFTEQTGCFIAGIQRHKRMKRDLRNKIRLRPGDVLLIAGTHANLRRLRLDRDLMVLEGSVSTILDFTRAKYALGIFAAIVLSAAIGVIPIVISALVGALAMIVVGCINIAQAGRAIDRQIVLLITASIAMSLALDKTGGAAFVADSMVHLLSGASAAVMLSGLFLLIAVLTNLLSNNATALLFTPIAISIAASLGVSAVPFVHAVIFAANCSFASPMGYQTNLLVMRPGNYKFADFFRTGGPLVVLIWVVFSLLAPWYYGL